MGSIPAETTWHPFSQEKTFPQQIPIFITFDLGSKLYYFHSNCSAMNNTSSQIVVVYRRKEGGIDLRELTSNVFLTVQMLEAQGCIIIDIIDIGFTGN